MTSLIEKVKEELSRFHSRSCYPDATEFEIGEAANKIIAIIESAKSESQEPTAYRLNFVEGDSYLTEDPAGYDDYAIEFNIQISSIDNLFTHPPLSDEFKIDAKLGKLLREKMTSGNDVPVSRCIITRMEFDEEMKASNETKGA